MDETLNDMSAACNDILVSLQRYRYDYSLSKKNRRNLNKVAELLAEAYLCEDLLPGELYLCFFNAYVSLCLSDRADDNYDFAEMFAHAFGAEGVMTAMQIHCYVDFETIVKYAGTDDPLEILRPEKVRQTIYQCPGIVHFTRLQPKTAPAAPSAPRPDPDTHAARLATAEAELAAIEAELEALESDIADRPTRKARRRARFNRKHQLKRLREAKSTAADALKRLQASVPQ